MQFHINRLFFKRSNLKFILIHFSKGVDLVEITNPRGLVIFEVDFWLFYCGLKPYLCGLVEGDRSWPIFEMRLFGRYFYRFEALQNLAR